MALILTEDEKVAIERHVREINEKNEELHHQRVVRYTAMVGLFTGAIFAVLGWAFITITYGVREETVSLAKTEVHEEAKSTDTLEILKSSVKQANDQAVQAARYADGAARSAEATENSAEATKNAASESENSLTTLRNNVNAVQSLAAAIQNTVDLANAIAKDPKFQALIIQQLSEPIKKLEDNLQNLKDNLRTYRTQGNDPNYYGTVDIGNTGNARSGAVPAPLVDPQGKPVVFYCKTGYYMIGINFSSNPTGPTSAQIMCSQLGQFQ